MSSGIKERKLAFFQAFERHGNVRRAMREAGVRSPATAYRWLEHYHANGPEWAHAERQPTRRVPPDIANLIVRLSESQPGWGKTRIAGYINGLHGDRAVSAGGVQSVMREVGLWLPSPPALPSPGVTPPSAEVLAERAKVGIHLDIEGNPLGAVRILEPEVWRWFRGDPAGLHKVLVIPVEGSWILRGLLQLSHAFIDVGRWRSARVLLEALDTWFASPASRPSDVQAAFQDEGRRYFDADGSIHVFTPANLPPAFRQRESVSLRSDDIWLESQQYLALVYRDIGALQAVERLSHVSRELRLPRRRSIEDGKRGEMYRGVIQHDLAVAQLLSGWPIGDTYRTITDALTIFDQGANLGMLSSAWLQLGRLQISEARRNGLPLERAANLVESSVAAAMATADREHAPVLRSNLDFHAVDLLLQIRPPSASDRERILSLAESVIQRHLSRWARLLVEAPHLAAHVEPVREDLHEIGWPT